MLAHGTGLCYGGVLDRESQATDLLYLRALARGRWGQFKSMLTGRPHCLLDLASVQANCRVHARSDAGQRTVQINQIRGSENRAADFDCDFNPLQDCTRDRWLSVATAWYRGRVLPPVELLQVGHVYFVRDGHHRISTARALGQQYIEAKVIAWQTVGPLPWEESSAVQETAGIRRLCEKARDDIARFQKCFLASLGNLLTRLSSKLKAPAVS